MLELPDLQENPTDDDSQASANGDGEVMLVMTKSNEDNVLVLCFDIEMDGWMN